MPVRMPCRGCAGVPSLVLSISVKPRATADKEMQNGGFPTEAFERLATIEPGHYWFEARNALIVWSMRRYFPKAASMHELGCGTGFVLQAIREAFPQMQLSASDALEPGLAIAAARVPSATLTKLDARDFDESNKFDVVCAFDVLEHIPDDAQVMSRMYRAVRPGGGAIVTVPQHPELWSRADEYGHHVRRYRRRELASRLQAAGFDVVRITSFVSLLLPLFAASRWVENRRQGALSGAEVEVSPIVNAVLRGILNVERQSIRLGVSWPAGGSLLAIARKS